MISSIPQKARFKALKEALDKREYLEFIGQVKQQISGTDITTKFTPTYVCFDMDGVERRFLETQPCQPLI